MEQLAVDPWYAAFQSSLFLASICTWIYLIARALLGRAILPYEPRRPVPWGPFAGLLAIAFVALALFSALSNTGIPEPPPNEPDPWTTASGLVGMIAFQALITVGAVAVVVFFSRPTERDLGLPRDAPQAFRDAGIGVVACLAAVLPVFAVQLVIVSLMGDTEAIERNELIDMVLTNRHRGVMLLASIAAVIMAPLSEEIVFRLLLQGWLEKWEDQLLGWRKSAREPAAIELVPNGGMTIVEMTNEECRMTNAEETQIFDSSSEFLPADPPIAGVLGLPHGWLPILVSSFLFAIAHFGAGFDPVPLFPLACILGFIYQRTHRILPSIAMHAFFNLITVLTLWRLITLPGEP